MAEKCDWCGTDTDFQDRNTTPSDSQPCLLCPSCVISVLPNTPVHLEQSNTTTDKGENERRRIERLPVQTRIYLTRPGQTAEVFQITLLDISDTGMKIQLGEKLNVHEKVTIGFLSTTLIYKAIGTVKHVSEVSSEEKDLFETGLRITGINQELRF